MNQVIKDMIYGLGNQKQAKFLAEIGGMSKEEEQVLLMIHDGKTDLAIQTELGLSRNAYRGVEEIVRAKLRLAIFECINYRMQ